MNTRNSLRLFGTLHTKILEDHDADIMVEVRVPGDEKNHDINQNKRGIEAHESIQNDDDVSAGNKKQKVNPGSQDTPPTAVVNSSNSSTTADGANVADRPNVISRGRATPRRGTKVAER